MKTSRCSTILASLVILGFAIPGAAIAENGGKVCSYQGSWFGVESLEDKTLTGWMITVTGQSANRGTNIFEFPTFDVTLYDNFPTAVRGSTSRGVWERNGGNTFEYVFTGLMVDVDDQPVWISKVSGTVTLSKDCNFEIITATLFVYLPSMNPFEDAPLFYLPLPEHYGYRAQLD